MDTILEPILLSRLQFALTIMFHILFPILTIGLGLYLVVAEALWLRTGKEIYYRMCRFWARIFAINFGVGVVSGIVMEFEFGTNWSRFSFIAANVFSPLLYFEVMTAFFLEASFLGIMLLGWTRVHRSIHFLATCMVAGGAMLSATWIMAANSWMQTPAGYYLADGKFMVTTFSDAVFNPSFVVRTLHMLLASFETALFAIAGISAFFLLKKVHEPFYRRSLGLAIIMAASIAPLQVYVGDLSGCDVFRTQPAKLAAMESHWETNTGNGAPLFLFALPDRKNEKNHFEIPIPDGLSLLLTYSRNGRVHGLKEFPPGDRPNPFILFWSFRFMAGIGFLFLFLIIWAFVLWKQRRLFDSRPFLLTLVAAQPLGWLATEMGWITAEVGRQPWLVYNVMRVTDGISPIPAGNVIWSLALFMVIFVIVGSSYFYFVFKVLGKGPDLTSPLPHGEGTGTAAGKISV